MFLKAVSQAGKRNGEQIIGFAIWKHEKEPMPSKLEKTEDIVEVWPDENDREYTTRLWRDYVVPMNLSVKQSSGKGVYSKWKQIAKN